LNLHLEIDCNGSEVYDDDDDTLKWSAIIREKDRLGLFGNGAPKKEFWIKRQEVTGDW